MRIRATFTWGGGTGRVKSYVVMTGDEGSMKYSIGLFPGDLPFPSRCNQRRQAAPALAAPKQPPRVHHRGEGDEELWPSPGHVPCLWWETGHREGQTHWKPMEKERAVPTEAVGMVERQKYQIATILPLVREILTGPDGPWASAASVHCRVRR